MKVKKAPSEWRGSWGGRTELLEQRGGLHPRRIAERAFACALQQDIRSSVAGLPALRVPEGVLAAEHDVEDNPAAPLHGTVRPGQHEPLHPLNNLSRFAYKP